MNAPHAQLLICNVMLIDAYSAYIRSDRINLGSKFKPTRLDKDTIEGYLNLRQGYQAHSRQQHSGGHITMTLPWILVAFATLFTCK